MDQLPPDHQGASGDANRPAPPSDLVAAQIKRQLQSEAAPPGAPAPPAAPGARPAPKAPAAADPGFAFNMRMRAGGNELTDTAAEFKSEKGEAAAPPAFTERDWDRGDEAQGGGGGGAMKIVLIVLGVAAVGVAVWLWVIPALKSSQEHSATTASSGGETTTAKGADGKPVALQAVPVDDAFDTSVHDALVEGNKAWKAAGVKAHAYRYHIKEEKSDTSQTITISTMVGGPDAAKGARDARTAFDKQTASFLNGVNAHPGVKCEFDLIEADDDSTPEDNDKYLFYGYDYGHEHMAQLKPIISALEQLKRDKHSYPRVLDDTIVSPKIRTSGGIKFMSRGFGYVPIYKTDAAGNIEMGTGGTLDRMTPVEVSGYYLFMYLGDETGGLDVFSQAEVDYYSRKLAPLPYDIGGAKLHNMELKPDGKVDGIAAVVKDGQVVDEGEK